MIKIKFWVRGAYYAVCAENQRSSKGSDAEMEERTIERLNELNEIRPEVTMMPEPDNLHDPYAVRVWCQGKPLGYVAADYARKIYPLFSENNRYLAASIELVEVKKRGNVCVAMDVSRKEWQRCLDMPEAKNPWKEWKCNIDVMMLPTEWKSRDMAECLLERHLLCLDKEDTANVKKYVGLWMNNASTDLSMETCRMRQRYIDTLLAAGEPELEPLVRELEEENTAACSGRREEERLAWWKTMSESEEMDQYWNHWLSHRQEDNLWKDLCTVDTFLRSMPNDMYSHIGNLELLLSNLYYRRDVPRETLWKIYCLLWLRERICRELGINMRPLPAHAYKGEEENETATAGATPEMVTDAQLVNGVQNCASYFWAQSSWTVVYCVLRDGGLVGDNVSEFEKRVQGLTFTKNVYACPEGTISKGFSNNTYMKMPIDKWGNKRALTLAGALRTFF